MNNDGDMSVNGQAVVCEMIDSAIVKLYNWLQKFSNVILVGHNARRFDFLY